jgi:hypothetical protein
VRRQVHAVAVVLAGADAKIDNAQRIIEAGELGRAGFEPAKA